MGLTELNSDIQVEGDRLVQGLRKRHPELQFIMVVLPYSPINTTHLSGEQIVQMERRVGYAARKELSTAIKEMGV